MKKRTVLKYRQTLSFYWFIENTLECPFEFAHLFVVSVTWNSITRAILYRLGNFLYLLIIINYYVEPNIIKKCIYFFIFRITNMYTCFFRVKQILIMTIKRKPFEQLRPNRWKRDEILVTVVL